MVQANAINYYSPTKWVVSTVGGEGTHTTIAGALTSASSGDTIFIMPGTYTENPTLKGGVNLVAFVGDGDTPNVIINGKCTLTTAGQVVISGIQLRTNSDFFLAVTGSAASAINLEHCYLNCLNNTGISYTSSSGSSSIIVKDCFGNLGTTGIGIYSSSGAGTFDWYNTAITNSGASSTASSNSANTIHHFYCVFNSPFSTSSGATIGAFSSSYNTTSINTTAITTAGTGSATLEFCEVLSGTASALSAGVGTTILAYHTRINSSNTNAVTGAGTYTSAYVNFSGSSSTVNTTTQTYQPFTVAIQTFTGSGTYTPTTNMKFCIIEAVGGGGGGGGCPSTTSAQESVGAGGGAGEYARGVFSAATIGGSQSVTINSGGGGNSGVAGSNGGSVVVGSTIISANGGTGGNASAATTTTTGVSGSLGGTGGTGGSFRTPGQAGFYGLAQISASSPIFIFSGQGGSSQYGAGGIAVQGASGAGNNALGYGAGGGGASNLVSQSARSGGNGTTGIVIVTEFVLS